MCAHPLESEAEDIRKKHPEIRPVPLGIQPSFGFGDRIGNATPGHIRALRRMRPRGILPVFAQQSIREMTRTDRSPQEVMDAALVAVSREGWSQPWGADADHLKTEEDIRVTMAAGFTMFTIDPSDYVDENGSNLPAEKVDTKFETLFKNTDDRLSYLEKYAGRRFTLKSGEVLTVSEQEAKRSAVIYLRAINHIVRMTQYAEELWNHPEPFDLEISVDETETPTTPAAHAILVSELAEKNIRFTAIAPRFVGRFEKGVDYRGDPEELDTHIRQHADIAATLGPYKLSLHSGSDKFLVYPILARYAGSLIHVKTAGTSYLEALRVVARQDPVLFRSIAENSVRVFEQAQATYHLTTDLSRVPNPHELSDEELEPSFLSSPESDDARQVMHVAYGDILTHPDFGPKILSVLSEGSDEYAECLADHFERHLRGLA